MTKELANEIAEKESVVKRNSASPDASFDLAITYAYTNKIEAGLNELKKTADLAGDKKKYSRELIEKYYSLVQRNPSDWKIHFRLAFAYYFGGYKKYAIEELKNISVIDPKNPWPHGYMAIIYAEDENWQDGIKAMKKAISLDSNVAAFHAGLAAAYYKVNNPVPGFVEMAEALRLKAMGY